METKRFLIIPCLLFSVQSTSAELKDECPQLPPAIKAIEPKYSDREAHKAFEEKYAEEFKAVDLQWEELEQSYTESRKRFYDLYTYDRDGFEILEDVKSACWKEVTGINEYEKDNACHELEKPPGREQWTEILICTLEKAKLLNIKLD